MPNKKLICPSPKKELSIKWDNFINDFKITGKLGVTAIKNNFGFIKYHMELDNDIAQLFDHIMYYKTDVTGFDGVAIAQTYFSEELILATIQSNIKLLAALSGCTIDIYTDGNYAYHNSGAIPIIICHNKLSDKTAGVMIDIHQNDNIYSAFITPTITFSGRIAKR